MEFHFSSFKSQKMMLWNCCTQYVSKSGKLRRGHRAGKGQFSFQSQIKGMPKTVQVQFSSVQSVSHVWFFVTPWTAAHQASLSLTVSPSLPSSSPLHQWCHPAISSSDVFFSFCPQSFPASRSFPMSWLFISGDWSFSISPSNEYSGLIFFKIDWFDVITVQRISGVFSSSTVWRHQFFDALLFLWSSSHSHMWLLGRP